MNKSNSTLCSYMHKNQTEIMKHTLLIAGACALFSFASCSNTTNTTPPKADSTAAPMESKAEKNKKTIMKGLDAMSSTHDANKVLMDTSPDFTEYQDGTMPPVKGDSAKQALQQYLNAFPDMKIENSQYFADENSVVVISDYSMTFSKDLGPIKATGKSAKIKDVDIFTFNADGKVASHRSIYPNSATFMQLGVDMSKMQAMMEKEKKK
jgi:hypothetical protein